MVILLIAFTMGVQAQKDSITYNSTCVDYKIQFSSTIYKTIGFPTYVSWNFGDSLSGFYNHASSSTAVHAFSAPGAYQVSLTLVNAGDTIRLTDSVHIITPMAWDFGPDIFLCAKMDTVLQGPVVPGATYLWNNDSATRDSAVHIARTGVYTVKVNGCAVADSIGVFYSSVPVVSLGQDHIMCAGETLTLNATSQNGNYSWTLDGAPVPGATEGQLVTQAPGGEYIVTVTVPGCGVYADTAVITYSTAAAPPFSLGPDTLLCPKQVFPLYANLSGATWYTWSNNAHTQSINVKKPAKYWVFVTTPDACQVVDTVEVTYRGDQNLDFRDTSICKGSTLILDADFGIGTYQWVSDPAQRDDQNQTGQSTYYVYEPGLYSITAQVGTCVYKDSLRVTFNDTIKMDIGKDTTLCIGVDLTLHLATNTDNFAWQDGSTGLSMPAIDSGLYRVTAENACGKDTVSVHVIRKACDCELHMPNAFTPNLDGRNDYFRPVRPCKMTNFQMRIFDRFGKLVFVSNDFTKGWNGTYGGVPAENGTFIWIANYINTDTKTIQYRKGFVVVLH